MHRLSSYSFYKSRGINGKIKKWVVFLFKNITHFVNTLKHKLLRLVFTTLLK